MIGEQDKGAADRFRAGIIHRPALRQTPMDRRCAGRGAQRLRQRPDCVRGLSAQRGGAAPKRRPPLAGEYGKLREGRSRGRMDGVAPTTVP